MFQQRWKVCRLWAIVCYFAFSVKVFTMKNCWNCSFSSPSPFRKLCALFSVILDWDDHDSKWHAWLFSTFKKILGFGIILNTYVQTNLPFVNPLLNSCLWMCCFALFLTLFPCLFNVLYRMFQGIEPHCNISGSNQFGCVTFSSDIWVRNCFLMEICLMGPSILRGYNSLYVYTDSMI